MAVARLFKGFSGGASAGSGDSPASVITPDNASRRLQILDDFEQAGIGWLGRRMRGAINLISEKAAEKLKRPMDALLAQPLTVLLESDADSSGERSERPLNFQLTARNKIIDQTVRFALGGPQDDGRQTWWSISGHPKFTMQASFRAIAAVPRT